MVKYNLQDIATVSGKGGLFIVIKPTRSGVIIESLDEKKARIMIQTRHKISLLKEISIFTTDEAGSVALDLVFASIHSKYGNDLSTVSNESNEVKLRTFIEDVLPNHDRERVYTSDIKKVISWFGIINQFIPPTEEIEVIEEKPKKVTKQKANGSDETEKPKKEIIKKETQKKPKATK